MDFTVSRKALLAVAVTLLITLSVLFSVRYYTTQQEEVAQRKKTEITALLLATYVESFIDDRLRAAQMLANTWPGGAQANKDWFEDKAQSLHAILPGFQAVNYVGPDHKIKWVTPYNENQQAIGLDLSKHPVAGGLVRVVEQLGEMQATPPVELRQGGTGISVYIRIPPENGARGILNVVFRLDQMALKLINRSIASGYHVDIVDGDTMVTTTEVSEHESVNIHKDHPATESVVEQKIQIANREWSLRISPEESSLATDEGLLLVGLPLSLILPILVGILFAHQARTDVSEQLNRTLINTSKDFLALLDRDGKVLTCNAAMATALQHTPESIIGTIVWDHLDSTEVRQRRIGVFHHILESGEAVEFQDRNGGVWFDQTWQPVLDAQQRVIAIAIFARDVTQLLQQAERQEEKSRELERSNADLEQFAYVASHDLREPLRMVTAYLSLIERRHGDSLDAEAKEFMDYARAGASRMDSLILDLLEYARVGRDSNPPSAVDMSTVVRRIMSDMGADIESANASIEIKGILPVVLGYGSDLERLMRNLIGNGMKYRRPEVSPIVEISVEDEGDKWLFSIKDNGIGIAPKFHSKIFVIFQRLHGRDEYQGTGIGLAICKKVVDRHGGRIWVVSAVGEGATFYFTLPKRLPVQG